MRRREGWNSSDVRQRRCVDYRNSNNGPKLHPGVSRHLELAAVLLTFSDKRRKGRRY
jgi:hypothetical protein